MAPLVVIRPIELPSDAVNHNAPSGPAAMSWAPGAAPGKRLIEPPVVMRPIADAPGAVNHRLLSGPRVIASGLASGTLMLYSARSPAGVILPIWLSRGWVNHSAPSGPAAI